MSKGFLELTRNGSGREEMINFDHVHCFRDVTKDEQTREPGCGMWLDGGYFRDKYEIVRDEILKRQIARIFLPLKEDA